MADKNEEGSATEEKGVPADSNWSRVTRRGGEERKVFSLKIPFFQTGKCCERQRLFIWTILVAHAVNGVDDIAVRPYVGNFLAQFFDMAINGTFRHDAVVAVHLFH